MQTLVEIYPFIVAHLEDDTARLRYALALPEGDPRRRFILLQLQSAHILSHEGNADDWDLEHRVRKEAAALLAQHGAEWAAAVQKVVPGAKLGFNRGFVEEIDLSPRQFLARAEALFAAAPILKVRLTDADGLSALLQSLHLDRVRALSLSGVKIGEVGAHAIAASPHVRGLRWLSLHGGGIGPGGLEALAQSPNLPELRWAELGANGFPLPAEQPGSTDGDWVYDWQLPALGRELEARHGRKEWLHPRVQQNLNWYPPSWQRLTGGRPEVLKKELFPEAATGKGIKPAAKPAALELPRYFAYNDRPIKFVATPEGGMDVLALNLRTGQLETNRDYLWVYTGKLSKPFADIDELDEAAFNRLVEMHRNNPPPKK